MEFLKDGLEDRIKQAAEFDKILKYVKQKALLPSRLGSGELGSQVFADLREILDKINNEIINSREESRQRCRIDELERAIAELETSADETEGEWMENSDYVPFNESNITNGVISPINASNISNSSAIENQSILTHTPAFNNFVARRLNFEDSFKKF